MQAAAGRGRVQACASVAAEETKESTTEQKREGDEFYEVPLPFCVLLIAI